MHRGDICQETGGRDVALRRDLSYVSRITVDICPWVKHANYAVVKTSLCTLCASVNSLSDEYFDYVDFVSHCDLLIHLDQKGWSFSVLNICQMLIAIRGIKYTYIHVQFNQPIILIILLLGSSSSSPSNKYLGRSCSQFIIRCKMKYFCILMNFKFDMWINPNFSIWIYMDISELLHNCSRELTYYIYTCLIEGSSQSVVSWWTINVQIRSFCIK